MKKWAYYNEFDPHAAQWLRNLISRGLIAPGEVDERSIEDVLPDDIRGFLQCHFFAGVGVWSYALRRAGWRDDRPVWTGSCPCQPFSAAGKGDGFDDERHLWPAFFHLIETAKPKAVPIFGEQVASKDGLAWIDLVRSDMEGEGYSFGAADICAAGFGAPHIRQRLFFVADRLGDTIVERLQGYTGDECGEAGWQEPDRSAPETGVSCGMEHTNGDGFDQGRGSFPASGDDGLERKSSSGIMAHPESWIDGELRKQEATAGTRSRYKLPRILRGDGDIKSASPTNGFWRDADWLFCRDERWRAVEPGTFPLVDGASAGMERLYSKRRTIGLKGYGNAINGEVAAEFIAAYMSTREIA